MLLIFDVLFTRGISYGKAFVGASTTPEFCYGMTIKGGLSWGMCALAVLRKQDERKLTATEPSARTFTQIAAIDLLSILCVAMETKIPIPVYEECVLKKHFTVASFP